jgi:hypothetical protein
MIFTFLLGLAAGAADALRGALRAAGAGERDAVGYPFVDRSEMDLLTLVLLLLAAALLTGGGSSFALLLGAPRSGFSNASWRRSRADEEVTHDPRRSDDRRGRDRAERGPSRDHADGGQYRRQAGAGGQPLPFRGNQRALDFDRAAARGHRLDIAAGTAVRFEPGQTREVQLVPFGGAGEVWGFNQQVMGKL